MATIDLGAGIGGLVAAFEAVDEIRPAGLDINLLPQSTRELAALGVLDRLPASALA